MAGRRCTTCGAAVGAFAEQCPRCGADPELALIEIGSNDDRPGPVWRRPPGKRRSWRSVVGAVIVAWAVVAAVGTLRGDSTDDGTASDDASATTAANRRPRTPSSSGRAVVEPLALAEA